MLPPPKPKDHMIESLAEAAEAKAAFKLPKKLVEDLDRCVTTCIT